MCSNRSLEFRLKVRFLVRVFVTGAEGMPVALPRESASIYSLSISYTDPCEFKFSGNCRHFCVYSGRNGRIQVTIIASYVDSPGISALPLRIPDVNNNLNLKEITFGFRCLYQVI